MRDLKIKKLTESGIMIALATVLSLVTVFRMPQGGSITAASMAPIVFFSFRYSTKWGVFAAFVYSIIQMLLGGISTPPVANFAYYAGVVLLDYVIAFTVLGLAGWIGGLIKGNRYLAVGVGTTAAMALRFVCHFATGWVIWGVYAEGQPAWLYSLTYNASYMIPETIVTVVVMCVLARFIDFQTLHTPAQAGRQAASQI